MDLYEKIRSLPTKPGVYLYKNAEGEVIYVGKANNLRSRVRSYLLEASQANAKTGSLMREAVDLEYILVANEHEALALENNLIKQRKPRFNILLRDDKTYPYVKLTLGDRFPKVFVTRRVRKDGAAYYGPYFPGNLAYRVVELIHRSFLLPSCKVDLSRYHPRACLQYYIHRCLGPCVEGLTTPETYKEAVRDAQLFLEGRHAELERTLTARMIAAAQAEQFEAAARLRDQLSTVHQLQEKQRIATAELDDDADVFGYHFEDGSLAVNLFHVRNGKIVDRREFFWEDLPSLIDVTDAEAFDQEPHTQPVILNDQSATQAVEGSDIQPVILSDRSAAQAAEGSDIQPVILSDRSAAQGVEGPDIQPVILSDRSAAQGVEGPDIQPVILSDRSAAQGVEGPAVAFPNAHSPRNALHQGATSVAPKRTNQNNGALAPEGETPFHAGAVFSALLKQLYIDQQYVPRTILVPVDFNDRETLSALLTERTGHKIEIAMPQRGEKRSLVDLAAQNAKQSYTQRFRVLEPSRKAIQEALADVLMLPDLPRRIECFDISHIQGAETVASMVVWEDGKMNKSAYRKFKVKTVAGVDDFAAMREVVERRYRRIRDNGESSTHSDFSQLQKLGTPGPSHLGTRDASKANLTVLKGQAFGRANNAPNKQMALSPASETALSASAAPRTQEVSGHDFSRAETGTLINEGALAPEGKSKEPKTMPSLVLVDGGLGQLHAAAEALESLGLTSQPLASIAKKEEIIYLYGSEDEPIVLDRRSPVLHLVQLIRDESHRFAVGYHRQRRAMRDRDSELLNIPGVGSSTRQRLLTHFGSLRDVQQATAESLAAVVSRKTAETIWRHFHQDSISD